MKRLKMTDQKVIDDEGNVAVLISSGGYSGGYYTSNRDHPECVFDPFVIEIVSKPEWSKDPENLESIKNHLSDKYGDFDVWGVRQLEIHWVPEGTKFTIREYDDCEFIEFKNKIRLFKA